MPIWPLRWRAADPRVRLRWRAVLPMAGLSILLAVSVVGVALRLIPARWSLLLAAVSFAPYLMLGAPCALVLAVGRRQWIATSVAVLMTAICVSAQAPLFVADGAPGKGVSLVLMTANLRLGSADPASIVTQVRTGHVDLLTTQELTAIEANALDKAGLTSALPYSVLSARDGAAGSGIWSRYPLEQSQTFAQFTFALVVARTHVPNLAVDPTIAVTHMPGPWPQDPTDWRKDIAALPRALATLSSQNPRGTILVGGDFNATLDTEQFRSLLANGYRDGAEQAGAGWTPTYPGDTWFGPLVAIDHVLTRNAVAVSAHSVSLKRSDHRGLRVRVVIES